MVETKGRVTNRTVRKNRGKRNVRGGWMDGGGTGERRGREERGERGGWGGGRVVSKEHF